MTLDEVIQRVDANSDVELVAGQDLDFGTLVTVGADLKLYKYDTSTDTNHLLGYTVTKTGAGNPSVLRLNGYASALCFAGCSAQDRLMPSIGNPGYVDTWTAGNPICGYALQDIAAGAHGYVAIRQYK